MMSVARLVVVVAFIASCAACERESRRYEHDPGPPDAARPGRSPYQQNAFGIAQGKELYFRFNCVGCHAQGGGAIGPALVDNVWIYGNTPEQLYETIAKGRPNGMPAFGHRVPDQQVWQLVSYVQALTGDVPKDAATSRADDLYVIEPENRKERARPIVTGPQ